MNEHLTPREAVPYPLDRSNMAEGNGETEQPQERQQRREERGGRREAIRRAADQSLEDNEELQRLHDQLAREEEARRAQEQAEEQESREAGEVPPQAAAGDGEGGEPPEEPPEAPGTTPPEEPEGEQQPTDVEGLPPNQAELQARALERMDQEEAERMNLTAEEREFLQRYGLEFIRQLRRGLETQRRSSRSLIEEAQNRLDRAESLNDAREELKRFRKYWEMLENAEGISDEIKEEADRYKRNLDPLLDNNSLAEIKRLGGEISRRLQTRLKPFEDRPAREIVHSFEDLIELIMDSEGSKWRRGGELALVNEDESINNDNFVAWIRSRIWYYDDFNPDSEINLFSDINIPTLYRQITFSEMLYTPRYFQKTVTLETRDEVGRVTNREVSRETDPTLQRIKDEVLFEVWLSMINHNNDANYRQAMGNEKALPETLLKVHYNSVFTKDRWRLLAMMKQAGIREVTDHMRWDTEKRSQGLVGKLIQRGVLAYKWIGDREQFQKVFSEGTQEVFFKSVVEQVFREKIRLLKEEKFNRDRESFIQDFVRRNGRQPLEAEIDSAIDAVKIDIFGAEADKNDLLRILREGGQDNPNHFLRAVDIGDTEFNFLIDNPELFARKAMAYRYDNDPRDFKNWHDIESIMANSVKLQGDQYMFNFYRNVKADQEQINLVRKAIRDAFYESLKEKRMSEEIEAVRRVESNSANQQDRDLAKKVAAREKLDVEYAEMWAYRFTYWTGISASNDTGAISFDKWGQEINTRDYRIRQGNARGPFGIQDTVWGIRRLSLNFWDGLKIKKEGGLAFDTPLIEAIQGGEGNNVDLERGIEGFDFEGNAQRQYMVDHISAGFKLASFLIDGHGMNFDKIFTFGYGGKLIIDWDKAREVIQDNVWHDLRYAFDQAQFSWDKKIRTWWTEYTKDGPIVKFGERTLRDYCFDEVVQGMGMYKRDGVPTGEGTAMARDVFSFLVGKEIGWHVQDREGTPKWGLPQFRLIKEYFDTWGYGLKPVDKKGNSIITAENGEQVGVDKNGNVLYKDAKVDRVIHSLPFFSPDEWLQIGETGNAETKKIIRSLLWQFFWLTLLYSAFGGIRESRKILTGAVKEQ